MLNAKETILKKEILFCPSFFYKFDQKQWKDQRPYPPYGTMYAAALMRELGHEVHIFDTHLRSSTSELLEHLDKIKPKYFVVYDDGFNYLTKMCLTAMRSAAFELMRMAKDYGCTVMVCNSDSTDHFEMYLGQGADFVIFGEGEITLSELIAELERGTGNFSDILGISFKNTDGVMVNAKRPILHDLDILPTPAWDLVDLSKYKAIWTKAHGYFSLNLATTRGCPYKCNWCAKPIYGNRYNTRSPKRVVDEMAMLVKNYGAQHFWIADDIFGLKPNWVKNFREEVENSNLKVKYKIQSRADLLLQEAYIDDLATSGLDMAWIGAESGSQKILDAMDKGILVEQIHEATNKLKARGIGVGFFLQYGYLGEEFEDIQKTLALLKELNPDDIGISISYPLPGTKFYELVKDQLSAKQNWLDSDDLDMMYNATYSPKFYKRLHRYTHKVFRLNNGFINLKLALNLKKTKHAAFYTSMVSIIYYLPAMILDRIQLQFLKSFR